MPHPGSSRFALTKPATGLNSLAELYRAQGRYVEAEPLYQRSLEILEKTLGTEHRNVATGLNNLAILYYAQGRYVDAEPLFKRSLEIREKALGPEHPDVATSLNNLAALYNAQGRYADAEPLYKRSLAIREKALGPEHPKVATGLNNLAGLYWNRGQIALALDHIRRASAIHRVRAAGAGGRSGGGLSEQKQVRYVFVSHAHAAISMADKEPSRHALLTAEAFEAGQLARATSVGAAVAGMGARFGAGDDALAKIVRGYQDAVEEWRRLDKKLIDTVGKSKNEHSPETIKQLRTRLAGLDRRIENLDGRLAKDFPEYAELASPQPLPLGEAQKLLKSDEALLSYLVGKDETFLWVVRNGRAEMKRLDIGQKALDKAVRDLRAGLDLDLSDLPAFDTTQAFKLYGRIFASAEPLLEGVRHLFVVPDGPLQSLPLGVLVTRKPRKKASDFSGYLQTPWLARKYALTTLPSVSSLKALRTFAKAAQASKPFKGFGDPLLEV